RRPPRPGPGDRGGVAAAGAVRCPARHRAGLPRRAAQRRHHPAAPSAGPGRRRRGADRAARGARVPDRARAGPAAGGTGLPAPAAHRNRPRPAAPAGCGGVRPRWRGRGRRRLRAARRGLHPGGRSVTATVLDRRLVTLRDAARQWGAEFRTAGAVLDTDPDRVGELLDLAGVRCLATMLVPAEFGGAGLRLGEHRFHGMTAIERAVVLEELARGDAGLMLASPGASMSGVLVDVLADREQKEWFYGRLLERPTWT